MFASLAGCCRAESGFIWPRQRTANTPHYLIVYGATIHTDSCTLCAVRGLDTQLGSESTNLVGGLTADNKQPHYRKYSCLSHVAATSRHVTSRHVIRLPSKLSTDPSIRRSACCKLRERIQGRLFSRSTFRILCPPPPLPPFTRRERSTCTYCM